MVPRRLLECVDKSIVEDAQVELYGSSCNGFGMVHSDLDISLTFQGSEDGKDFSHKETIFDLARHLRKHGSLQEIKAIPWAKVPIVKFTHKGTGLEGDISLYNTMALHNTRLLKTYSELDERVRILGYTFKHFAKKCDINDASKGSLSSYAYILLTLYYLQQCNPPVIPVLQELYPEDEQKPEVMVDGCNTWFYDRTGDVCFVWKEFGSNCQSVGQLWLGLLKFYSEEFNFRDHVVSIRQKAIVTKDQKGWSRHCIAIEDPFELGRNLGKGVSEKVGAHIMSTLQRGYSLFRKPMLECPPEYNSFAEYFFSKENLAKASART
ncbi:hypothetical protein HPB50_006479 [Hyalomma asiaticum]|uniref:Uncharacterized protein n=1 Tax=Hyalomma asiaticum TaxID=266040 RepID=A0ACB7T3N9_HYAAI|nr:hypothetical protein HPB50_006479 [Hyalomma asiaticum]